MLSQARVVPTNGRMFSEEEELRYQELPSSFKGTVRYLSLLVGSTQLRGHIGSRSG